jgi:hypothetical protein
VGGLDNRELGRFLRQRGLRNVGRTGTAARR